MNIGVVVFPGSNCELDTQHVLKNLLGQEVNLLWHKQRDLEGWKMGTIFGRNSMIES